MNFDEWLEQRQKLYRGGDHDAYEKAIWSDYENLLLLVQGYREYLRHLLSDEGVQDMELRHIFAGLPCRKFPGNVTALEAALMGEEQ